MQSDPAIVDSDIHRERLSIEHSMRDLDSAVGRLDNILMTVYVVIAALIISKFLNSTRFIKGLIVHRP